MNYRADANSAFQFSLSMIDQKNATRTQDTQDDGKYEPQALDISENVALRADNEALLNDVKQANELAIDYQRQLAVKSNDLALSKQLIEQTQKRLRDLVDGIAELRKERQQLVDEVMRFKSLEGKFEQITVERDQLRRERDALQERLSTPANPILHLSSECDGMIDKLAVKAEALAKLLRTSGREPSRRPGNGSHEPKSGASFPRNTEIETETISIEFRA